MSLVAKVKDLVDSITRRLTFLPPAVARLTIGIVFLLSGWGKLHSLDQVTQFFTELGIPAPAAQAAFVSGVELVGGALVLVGLFTRAAAVPLACTMIVALLTAKREEIHGLADLAGQLEFAYLALCVWLAVAGGGALSLDAVIGRIFRRPRPTEVLVERAARM
jgi:putative oxidoreductase